MLSSFSSEGKGIPGGLSHELGKSLIGKKGSVLTSSVMYDFLPRWSDIQDAKEFFEFSRSVLLDMHYSNGSKN